MKTFALFLFCLSSFFLHSQDYFAPIGTKWYYWRSQFGPNPPNPGLALVEVVDTATIDGKPCIIVTGGEDCGQLPNPTYLFMEDGKVSFKHNGINQFLPLYDFNAGVGETFTTYTLYGGQKAILKVTSVETVTVGAQTFKIQHIEPDSGYVSWGDQIVQYAGSKRFLFPQSGACDPELDGLSCFDNGTFGYPVFPCAIVNTTNPEGISIIQIAPNPTSKLLSVSFECPEKRETSLQLIGVNGSSLLQKSITVNTGKNQIEIDVREIPKGLYFIVLGSKAIGKVAIE